MAKSISRPPRLLVALSLTVAFGVGSLVAGEGAPGLKLPPDVTYSSSEDSPGPVVFSHQTHFPLADEKCVACHTGLFPILKPTRSITHDEMNAGMKCGACHDGTNASGVQDDCEHCHRTGEGS